MQTPPAPPAPPIPDVPPLPPIPSLPPGTVLLDPSQPLPTTGMSADQIREIREILSDHLQNVSGRRNELAQELRQALAAGGPSVGAEAEGIRQRIELLDQRILRLEGDLETTSRQLALVASQEEGGDGGAVTYTETGYADNPFNMAPGQMTAVSIVFILFVLFPLALAAARNMLRRGSRPPPPPALPAESAQRLERLEQGMDAVAIEVERISEGQRFVTKLLTETRAQQQIPVAQRVPESVPVRGND